VTPEICVALPVFNEEGTLDELHRRLSAVLGGMGLSYELVFVDDGSADGSWAKLQALHARDPEHVRVVRFSRNFGHHVALTAAMRESRGRWTVIMDSDLQDRPEEIPALHARAQQGFDCVFGVRAVRRHGWFKRVTSSLFVTLMNRVVQMEVPINTSVLRIMNRRFVDSFNALPERHRFITGLMSWMGFRQVGIPVEHGERYAGDTKYSLSKMVLLSVAAVTSFTFRPLQLAAWMGTLTALAAMIGIGVLFYRRLVLGYGIVGWTSVMVTILFLGGVQLVALGVLGEYVGRSYEEQKRRPLYIVAERLGPAKPEPGVASADQG
jgi:dolichol-phosphate mannosyltransferase